MINIERVPIKVDRNPISIDMCSCSGLTVTHYGGTPSIVWADNTPLEKMKSILDGIEYTPTWGVSTNCEDLLDKVTLISSYGLPVMLNLIETPPIEVQTAMHKNPHSYAILPMASVNTSANKKLEGYTNEIYSLFNTMYELKIWKVSTTLFIDYYPHLSSPLEFLEAVSRLRNVSAHVTIRFRRLTKEQYDLHSTLTPFSLDDFYEYNGNEYVLLDKYKESLRGYMREFNKFSKVSNTYLIDSDENHLADEKHQWPLGVRPFLYRKVGKSFFKDFQIDSMICPDCGKPIFV